jgi:hypothetical protein
MDTENRKKEIGESRLVGLVDMGWHVRINGAWHLIRDRSNDRGVQVLFLDGQWQPHRYPAGHKLMSRSPAEQIEATVIERRERKARLLAEHARLVAAC